METQQSGYPPRSGPEVKNGSSAKDGAQERLIMHDNPGGSELDPAEVVRRRCKKSPYVLSCIDIAPIIVHKHILRPFK